jgi:hypothetical protein
MAVLAQLHALLRQVPSRLEELSAETVARRLAPSRWSPKEELGHLIDSAANHHQRIVRVQMRDGLALPGYEQNTWVAVHRYQERSWSELIGLWRSLNRQLLVAAEAVPPAAWEHVCTIADSEPMTLKYVFEDYLRHMLHHVEHIGIRVERVTDGDLGAGD